MARVALSLLGSAFARRAAPWGHVRILAHQLLHRQAILVAHGQRLQHALTSPGAELILELANLFFDRFLVGLDLLQLAGQLLAVYLRGLDLLLVPQPLCYPMVRLRESLDAGLEPGGNLLVRLTQRRG